MRHKIKPILALAFIFTLPFIAIYILHRFIDRPDYWKKTAAFIAGARYLGEEGITLQKSNKDCGPSSLKIIFDHYKIPVTLEEISDKVLGENGSTMLSLKKMAELKGLNAQGWRFAFKDIRKMIVPAIAFVNGNHYVVISQITDDGKIIVLDPSIGKMEYSNGRFKKIWNGESLIFKGKTPLKIGNTIPKFVNGKTSIPGTRHRGRR